MATRSGALFENKGKQTIATRDGKLRIGRGKSAPLSSAQQKELRIYIGAKELVAVAAPAPVKAEVAGDGDGGGQS